MQGESASEFWDIRGCNIDGFRSGAGPSSGVIWRVWSKYDGVGGW